jgi:hypothetical protein
MAEGNHTARERDADREQQRAAWALLKGGGDPDADPEPDMQKVVDSIPRGSI